MTIAYVVCLIVITAWGFYTLGRGIGWRAGFEACARVDDSFDRRMCAYEEAEASLEKAEDQR